jgi:hypothetical protein
MRRLISRVGAAALRWLVTHYISANSSRGTAWLRRSQRNYAAHGFGLCYMALLSLGLPLVDPGLDDAGALDGDVDHFGAAGDAQ